MKTLSFLIASLAIGVALLSNGCAMMGMHQRMPHAAAGSAHSGINEGGDQRTSIHMQRTDEPPPSPPLVLGKTQSVSEESNVLGKTTMWMGGLCMGVMMVGMMLL